jgi:Flp pilus assembly protein TadB
MSKQRARARAAREAAARQRDAELAARAERDAAARQRRARRDLMRRRLRLWQGAPRGRQHAERRAALVTLVLVVLLVTFLLTSSMGAVLLVGLVLLLASPLLIKLFFDRSPS